MVDWKAERWPVGCCSRCHGVIYNAPFRSLTEFGDFCSRECRDAHKTKRAGGRPKLNKREQLKSKTSRKEYQRYLMRKRRSTVLAKNPSQLIETKEVKNV